MAFIFLMDCANSQRVKLWGTAKVIENDPKTMTQLADPNYQDKVERAIRFNVEAWVVALSGGYSRDEANERLKRQHRVIASFSRALAEGLTVQQSDKEFNERLCRSIESIFIASITKSTY